LGISIAPEEHWLIYHNKGVTVLLDFNVNFEVVNLNNLLNKALKTSKFVAGVGRLCEGVH